jgi:glucosamine--fructose-6-phosphate aminotransferase (isomerizing)
VTTHKPLGSLMAAEMAEQPDVLRSIARRRREWPERVRAVLNRPPVGVVLIARGSSDNAAIFGRYALELAVGRPVALAAPSLHTLYAARVDYTGYLAVAVSQSGRTPEIVTVLQRLRRAGAVGIAITNEASSPLGSAGDAVLALEAGDERAVPATKTFTATVAAFAALAEALGPVSTTDQDWAALPGAVADVLADPEPAEQAARTIGDAAGVVAVGRGFLYGTALEAALKLKETSFVLAEGYSAADLRHGPIAVVQSDFPVLAFSAPGPAAADLAELTDLLRRRGASVIRVAPDAGAELAVPPAPPEPLVAIPATVRAQQVALALARQRGMDPDVPTGLSKVTPTT